MTSFGLSLVSIGIITKALKRNKLKHFNEYRLFQRQCILYMRIKSCFLGGYAAVCENNKLNLHGRNWGSLSSYRPSLSICKSH